MGVLLRWRRHAERIGQLLFGVVYPVPATTAACWPWLAHVDYWRLISEANPFDGMALLMEAPGIHPPLQGFEALLAGSQRMKEERA